MLKISKAWEKDGDVDWGVKEEDITSFERVEKKLIIRPINYPASKKLLEDHIFTRMDDIALVLYAIMKEVKGGRMTGKISKDIFSKWNVTEEFILRYAMENTARISPPILLPMELVMMGLDVMEGLPDESKFFMNPLINYEVTRSMIGTYCLSVARGISGAIAAFYPKVLDKVCAILNDDLYISFTSEKECMVHPASETSASAVRAVSKDQFQLPTGGEKDAENLTPHAYVYKRGEKVLKRL